MSRRSGFTKVELIVVLAILAIAVVLILPNLGGRGPSRRMSNSTQLRGIHQGMVIFAQSNASGGQDGFYAGLDRTGQLFEAGVLTRYAPDGANYTAAEAHLLDNTFAMLLDGNYFVPEYAINPHDPAMHEPVGGVVDATFNVSYAILKYDEPGLRPEWSETINENAVVLADRALPGTEWDPRSVWGEPGEQWSGTVTRNDGSTEFIEAPAAEGLVYGDSPAFDTTNIFSPDYGAADDRGQMFWD
jgi:prepilin-type N-terminal cleavage/methylation domain-containing protein